MRIVEDWPHAVDSPLGPHLAATFERAAWLRDRPRDDDLLAARLRVADDVVQEQIGLPGADDPEHVVLRQRGGLRRARTVDTATAGLVGACDGTLALGALIDAVAIVLDADTDDLRFRLGGIARELITEGFLQPRDRGAERKAGVMTAQTPTSTAPRAGPWARAPRRRWSSSPPGPSSSSRS